MSAELKNAISGAAAFCVRAMMRRAASVGRSLVKPSFVARSTTGTARPRHHSENRRVGVRQLRQRRRRQDFRNLCGIEAHANGRSVSAAIVHREREELENALRTGVASRTNRRQRRPIVGRRCDRRHRDRWLVAASRSTRNWFPLERRCVRMRLVRAVESLDAIAPNAGQQHGTNAMTERGDGRCPATFSF